MRGFFYPEINCNSRISSLNVLKKGKMKMKKGIKIVVIVMILIVLGTNCYATTETENKVKNEASEPQNQNATLTNETKPQVPEKPTETKKNETMYVQERCNIRSSYSVESDRVGGLDVGTEVTVIAEYSNGWYKIKYDAGEAYIKAGILRSTKPVIPEPEIPQEKPTQEPVSEEPQKQETEEPVATNIQNDDLAKEIGVLPEVGKNIADYLYVSAILVALVAVLGINLSKRK